MNQNNPYHELVKQNYNKVRKEARNIKIKNSTSIDPICQNNAYYEPIKPKRSVLLDEYLVKMSPKDKKENYNRNYMSSTVFKDYSDKPQVRSTLRGYLRQEQERKTKEIKVKSIKTFPRNFNSLQVGNALNYTEEECSKNAEECKTFAADHFPNNSNFKNTFSRIRNGDSSFDLRFRNNHLFKPQTFRKARQDNIGDLIQPKVTNDWKDENFNDLNSTKPNNLRYSQVIALTEEAIRDRKRDSIYPELLN